jgi:hypothetical protein
METTTLSGATGWTVLVFVAVVLFVAMWRRQ